MVSKPHGGELISRIASDKEKARILSEAREIPKLFISRDLASDLQNIAHGVYSPLKGFLIQEDFLHVLHEMRLSNDVPWTIPIILDVDPEEISGLKEGDELLLICYEKPLAIMRLEEIYGWNKEGYVQSVYKTRDSSHPGVAKTLKRKDLLIGGEITLIDHLPNSFENYTLWPIETRLLFKERGWRRIVGFQTRNVPHLGHEYVQKAALTFADGLFVNPLVGWKKPGDFKDEVIIKAYEALLRHYYPKDSVVFAVLQMEMRYAGPREAIHHAIVRKNFGCTHFIVGRDHAGVGNFYGPYEAWEIFKEFPDLGITPLFIRESFYCKKCGGMVNAKICPHGEDSRIRISRTKLRKLIRGGEKPPKEAMRPEVAEAILSFENPFVE
ncbi:MAG: sulfate adenylyltransferase [Thaumarchaeota archaeon]|nr:MAG: sulfate adenylyltransferase [Nitrososphaerota archaeon]